MSTLKANSYQHVDRASPSITINSDGSVSIASTVTYEDVTSVDSVGIITARSTIDAQGDVSIADKIIHTGDTNTAIRFPSADTVTVETGGTERLRILSDGSIGINSTSPAKFVDFVGITDADSQVVFANSTKAKSIQIRPNDNTIINYGSDFVLNTQTASTNLTFQTGGNERLRITSGGLVGINTASPTARLEIVESNVKTWTPTSQTELLVERAGNCIVSIVGRNDSNSVLNFGDNDDENVGYIDYDHADNSMAFRTNTSEALRIASTGEVLIGSASTLANTKLRVEGNGTTLLRVGNSDDGIAGISLANTGSSNWSIKNESANLRFEVAGSEKFRIASTGKVGIGSDAPSGTLSLLANNPNIRFDDESGSSSNNGEITLDNTQLRIEVDEDDVVASSQIKFRVDGGDRMNINSDGQVAINASSGNAPTHWDSSTRLSVNGRINSVGSASTASMNTGNGTVVNIGALTNHKLQFIVNNSTKATINTDGNANFVGIVTATQFVPTYTNTSYKNLLVNGEMFQNQRGTVASVNTGRYGGPDMVYFAVNDLGTYQLSRSSESPNELKYSYKVDCTTADASVGSSAYCFLIFKMEGYDVQRLAYGTSDAKDTTFSFWVRSSQTGTLAVRLRNLAGSGTRIIGENVTIDSANTWEKKIITFPGDTTTAINNVNAEELRIEMWLRAGTTFSSGAVPTAWEASTNADRGAGSSVNIQNSTSDEFYVTGLQFEVGSQATPYEHISYTENLAKCQRYYQVIEGNSDLVHFAFGRANGTTDVAASVPLAVPMRASPTVTCSGNKAWCVASSGTSNDAPTVIKWSQGASVLGLTFGGHSGLTNARACNVTCASASNLILSSAL